MKTYKWIMLALLSCAFFFHQADRVLFGLLTIPIQEDLHLTDLQIGVVNTSLFCTLAVTTPLAGFLGDRVSRKWIITASLLFWSLMTACTGFVGGLCGLVFFRSIATGGGESFYAPSAFALIAAHHKDTRSIALSIHQSALYVGILVSSVLAGYLGGASSSGWRISFWIFGGVAIVWLFILAAFLRNTPALKVHDEEVKPRFADAFKAFAAKPSAWLLTFAFGMLVFGSNCFRTWMPAFMQKANWGLTPASAAFHSVFWFYLGSFIGIAIGARTSDKLSPRRRGIRLTIMAIGLALSAPTMAGMVLVPTLWLSCVMMFFFGLGGGFFDCNLYAGLFDVVAPRYRSAAMGLYLSGAFFIGCPATAVLGWVGHNYSLQTGMALFGGTYALGALAIFAARLFFFKRDHVED